MLSQNEVDSLIKRGLLLHDEGNYALAIETYQKALKLDPENGLVIYEIAFSYFKKQDIDMSKSWIFRALKHEGNHQFYSNLLLGTIYDMEGLFDSTITIYNRLIHNFEPDVTVYFNKAITYYKMDKLDSAITSLEKAIQINYFHPGSHFMYSLILNELNDQTRSILSGCFALLLEAGTDRATQTLERVKSLTKKNITKNETSNGYNININANNLKKDFTSPELMLALNGAMRHSSKYIELSDGEFLVNILATYITTLTKTEKKDPHSDIVFTFYLPFYKSLVENKHLETFLFVILKEMDDQKISIWLAEYNDKVDAMYEFLNKEE